MKINDTKKLILIICMAMIGLTSYSQIDFENGYYIDNAGKRINCLIRNVDWMKNPTDFHFKLSQNEKPQIITINEVKEFGILNISKYIRTTVDIDRSQDYIGKLSLRKEPKYIKEQLFLKVLVEGKASLYSYEDDRIKKYFFKTNVLDIKQLMFKKYKNQLNQIVTNNEYKQQLWNNLSSAENDQNYFKKVKYKKKELINVFIKYNAFFDGEILDFEHIKKKDLFNLTLRPGIKSSNLKLQRAFSDLNGTNYDNELSFRFGVEAETIMPFNKNKWSLLIELSYQYYKTEKILRADTRTPATVDYKTMEIAFGVRHYMYLNENSKLFLNGSYVLAVSNNSRIDYGDGYYLDLEKSSNMAFGLGYNYKNKYNLEFNYNLERGLLSSRSSVAIYNSFSVIFGYTLF